MKDLLKKWISSNTTWSEEKNLRQAARKDDFLFEALEGYDIFPTQDHAAKIKALKAKLPKSTKQQKHLFPILSKVAAAAAIIGVIGTFFWVQQKVKTPQILSEKVERLATPAAPTIATEETINDDLENLDEQSPLVNKEEEQKTTISIKPKPSATLTQEKIEVPQKEEIDESVAADYATELSAGTAITKKEKVQKPTTTNDLVTETYAPVEDIAYSTAESSSERDEIIVEKEAPTTPLASSTRKADTYSARSRPTNAAKKFQAPEKINYSRAIAPQPETGFVEFNTYLKKNLNYPKIAKQQGIEKEVEINFFIDKNGRPTNLKSVEVDSFGFAKEAIRLLENGPNWQPVNTEARYKVTFKLK